MSFLIIDGERYALPLGETTLGGSADEVLALSPLAALPPFATITSGIEETVTIRVLQGAPPVTRGDEALGAAPVPLRHGDRLVVSGLTILYGDVGALGRTSPVRGVDVAESDPLAVMSSAEGTAPTGGRLIARADDAVHPIPEGGLVIGRDPECGLVVNAGSVSRRHATIRPGLLGYTLHDESTNGVLVNERRIENSVLLHQGDVLRIGDVELRFEADAAEFEPAATLRPAETTVVPMAREQAANGGAAPLLATLEVLTRGVDEGRRYRIERPAVQLGRAPHNDVRITDESVSANHATLVHRGRWRLLDLDSRNGSYVDGERVTDCHLPNVCELRFGNVKLVFRAIQATQEHQATRGIVGLTDDQLRGRGDRER